MNKNEFDCDVEEIRKRGASSTCVLRKGHNNREINKKKVNFFNKNPFNGNISIMEFCTENADGSALWDQRRSLENENKEVKNHSRNRSISFDCMASPKVELKRQTTTTIKLLRKKIQSVELNTIENITVALEPNVNSRDHMEDFIDIKQVKTDGIKNKIFLLCDGHSGDQTAKKITENFHQIFANSLNQTRNLDKSLNITEAIYKAFYDMEENLKMFKDELKGSGSTMNLVFLHGEEGKICIYSANVGDSRTVLVRESTAERLSYDHKAIDKEEQKRVKKDGGIILRGRFFGQLAITRAMADFEFKDNVEGLSSVPHLTRTILDSTDRYLIIGSDGVWDVIQDDKLVGLVNEYESRKSNTSQQQKELATLIVEKALELGSKDNISCIAIKFNSV